MSRVEWSRRTPEEVESVIGIMLCRENPPATRVRPSRGDRGIDVYVPIDAGLVVYQVKSFTGSLNASRKRQITESWNSFTAFVAERDLVIHAWYLLRPENPTIEDEAWLAELTKEVTFPCAWKGLDFCDRLAADNASVVDYYLNDGKERLGDAVKDLMAFSTVDPAVMSEPANAEAALIAMHRTVNSLDPHFRYDFRVETVPTDEQGRPILGRPEVPEGLLAGATIARGNVAVTFHIFAQYNEAVAERPIPGRFTMLAEVGTTEGQAIQDFVEYGIAAARVPAEGMNLDLPGGLGLSAGSGTVSVGPAHLDAARPMHLRLAVVQGDSDDEVASADLVMEPATSGLNGEKFALAGQERFGVFQVRMRFDPGAGKQHLNIAALDLTGCDPHDVLAGLATLAALTPPNRIAFHLRNGPRLMAPMDIPNEMDIDVHDELLVCKALAIIQEFAYVPITVPDLTEVDIDIARAWIRAGRLLRGEIININWTKVGITLLPDAEIPTGDFTIAVQNKLAVEVGGVHVALGLQISRLMTARVDLASLNPDRPEEVELIPGVSDKATIQWAGRTAPQ